MTLVLVGKVQANGFRKAAFGGVRIGRYIEGMLKCLCFLRRCFEGFWCVSGVFRINLSSVRACLFIASRLGEERGC